MYFYKPITWPFSWFFVNFTNLTPNQLTYLSAVLGVISGILFFTNHMIIGALAMLFRFILDCADGEVARTKKIASSFGKFLDPYAGDIAMTAGVLGLCFGYFKITHDLGWLIIAPILTYVFFAHALESNYVASILANKFNILVRGYNSKKEKISKKQGLLWKFVLKTRAFLFKQKIAEPLNLTDVSTIIFVFGPIINLFCNCLQEIIIFLIIILLIKGVFWFFYYRKILLQIDLAEK